MGSHPGQTEQHAVKLVITHRNFPSLPSAGNKKSNNCCCWKTVQSQSPASIQHSPCELPGPAHGVCALWNPSMQDTGLYSLAHLALLYGGRQNTCILIFFGGKETAPPPEQRYRPRPVRAGVPGLLDLAGSHRLASKPVPVSTHIVSTHTCIISSNITAHVNSIAERTPKPLNPISIPLY